MSAQLSLHDLVRRFPGSDVPALDGLSLTVPAGSCTAVLGPSGSGKSTLLRVISGLEGLDAGEVRIGGADMSGVIAERRGVGMVFQRSLLFPHLSVRDNVGFADRIAGLPRAAARDRAENHLRMVQLEGFGDRRVDELSGGQAQRVAIARAIAAEPAVLLLDEPFSALDPALRADMHDLIDAIRRVVAPTIVLVTHDRDEAARVADRIAVIENGSLLHESVVADAYRRPQSLRAAQLMGGRNEIPGTVVNGVHISALGEIPVPSGTPDGSGTLLVRQEDLALAAGDAPVAGAGEVRLNGVVVSMRPAGARADIVVRLAGDVVLHAESVATRPPAVGRAVSLTVPADAMHVVQR